MKIHLPFALLLLLAACTGGEPSDTSASSDTVDTADTADTATDDCEGGGGEAPVGPCLVAKFAGTYAVAATSGAHTRGTIVLGEDGSVDYDEGLAFATADYEGVYDRLECCNRISVEMLQRADNDTGLASDARHRVDIFTDAPTTTSTVTSFEYYPNWPSDAGKVVLTVQ